MALTKPEGDGRHPASHYLVVLDEQATSTWHLPVLAADGQPDHRLMGAAWAALHGGYRGNRYEGPQKGAALSKLKALYRREGMTPPGASMSVQFALPDQAIAHPDDTATVVRVGKIFEVGDYPDKQFSLDAQELAATVAAFTEPIDLDIGDAHGATVLRGKMGQLVHLFAGEDGKSLLGEVHLPAWLDGLLSPTERKVSAEFDRGTKTLAGLHLVRHPRVTDAALFSAYTAAHPGADPGSGGPDRLLAAFAAGDWQTVHDLAANASAGATCRAGMAINAQVAHGLQAIHDIARSKNAACLPSGNSGYGNAPVNPPAFSTQPSPWYQLQGLDGRSHLVPPPQETPKEKRRMKVTDWLLGKAREEGVEGTDDEILAQFSRSDELATIRAENEALKAEQATQTAAFAQIETERRHEAAVQFTQQAIAAKRLPPGCAEAMTALAERALAADKASTVTFSDQHPALTTLLGALVQAMPDLALFSKPVLDRQLLADAAALFTAETTPAAHRRTEEDVDQARVDRVLAASPLGRDILAARIAAGSPTPGSNGK